MTARERFGSAFVYLTLAVAIFLALFPFWWMVATSLKRPIDIFSGVAFWPQELTFGNYYRLFNEFHFGSYLLNSVIIVAASVGISLVIGRMLCQLALPNYVQWFMRSTLGSEAWPPYEISSQFLSPYDKP